MMILVCFYALEMILKTFLKEELWKILFTFPHPIKKKKEVTAGQPLVSVSFM